MSLYYCSHCKENSVVKKLKKISENESSRIEFCINKGCGYKQKFSNIKMNKKESLTLI